MTQTSRNTLASRYGNSSPRTAEHPRAFTTFEFITGVFWAVLWFQPMAAVVALVVGLISSPMFAFAFVIGGGFVGLPVSVAAALVGAPFAGLLGRALKADSRDRVHVVAFTAFGVAIGLATAAVVGLVLGGSLLAGLMFAPFALPCGVAVPLGWWKTSRSALAADAHRAGGTAESE